MPKHSPIRISVGVTTAAVIVVATALTSACSVPGNCDTGAGVVHVTSSGSGASAHFYASRTFYGTLHFVDGRGRDVDYRTSALIGNGLGIAGNPQTQYIQVYDVRGNFCASQSVN